MTHTQKLVLGAGLLLALTGGLAAGALLLAGSSSAPVPAGAPRLSAAVKHQLSALPALRGAELRGGSLEGKVVAITFFASWCGPCRVELAHLNKIYARSRERGLEILAINLFEEFDGLSNDKRLAEFLRVTAPDFPVLKGDGAISATFGEIRRIPTLLVYDRAGRQAYRFVNEVGGRIMTADPGELDAVIAGLL